MPKLCQAVDDINITDNVILPAKNCNASNWTNKGSFGLLMPISENGIFTNNFSIDTTNQVVPTDYIVNPKLCLGYGNETVIRCSNKKKFGIKTVRDAIQCDNDMKKLCGSLEFSQDPICSCFKSSMKTLSNPGCVDMKCNEFGYKTQRMLTTPCNISNVPIDCDRFKRMPNVDPIHNEWTKYCFNTDQIDYPVPPVYTLTERSSDGTWFTNARIYIFILLLLVFFAVLYVNYS